MTAMPDMVVLGDINLDWVVPEQLAFPFAELTENGRIVWSPIAARPGGSGLNFAVFARAEGFQPLLLGKVGNDLAGRYLNDWLQQSGIQSAISVDGSLHTGVALIVRDSADIRFLVNNRDNANLTLSLTEVEAHTAAIRGSSVLYVSGYCVMDETATRTEAAQRAMNLASDPGSPHKPVVVFDVVPHRIYHLYSFARFQQITKCVDLLISEVSTMRRFLGLGSASEKVDRAVAEETAEALVQYYQRFILRFGPGGCDSQILCDAVHDRREYQAQTGHANAADKRGFGDVLAIRDMRGFFGIQPRANNVL
jgi:sugar/nucleoside kinase (ribokinase family)